MQMIKCEVVFDEELIICNGKEIEISMHEDYDKFYVVGKKIFSSLEQAVKHCMENNEWPTNKTEWDSQFHSTK